VYPRYWCFLGRCIRGIGAGLVECSRDGVILSVCAVSMSVLNKKNIISLRIKLGKHKNENRVGRFVNRGRLLV
jgi:hypothetical protein